MGVLIRCLAVALVALTSCYAPTVPDCLVACATIDDCAPGQVCGGDGRCVSPDLSGGCDLPADNDAGPPDTFEAPSDANPNGILAIEITGDGRVKVGTGNLDCDSTTPSCTYVLPIGMVVTLRATPDHQWQFDGWSGCTASANDCMVVIAPGTTVITATFLPN